MGITEIRAPRVRIRPFSLADLDAAIAALDADAAPAEIASTRADRERWLRWTVASYRELAALRQPPYADYAVVRDGAVIGACGLVPSLVPLSRGDPPTLGAPRAVPEVGLFWALAPDARGFGYATEAAAALAAWALRELGLARVVATTSRDNHRSRAVMHRLGMRVLDNPDPDAPAGLEVVGVLAR